MKRTRTVVAVIGQLADADAARGVSAGEIATTVGRPTSTVYAIFTKLVAENFVHEVPRPLGIAGTDRTYYRLTESGWDFADSLDLGKQRPEPVADTGTDEGVRDADVAAILALEFWDDEQTARVLGIPLDQVSSWTSYRGVDRRMRVRAADVLAARERVQGRRWRQKDAPSDG